MKDIANEAVKKGEEMSGEVVKEAKELANDKESNEAADVKPNNEVVEQTTPSKEGEEKEKTKVQKKRSFSRFSFLRKGSKAKDETPKTNGNVEVIF
jgi:hypothetical protein